MNNFGLCGESGRGGGGGGTLSAANSPNSAVLYFWRTLCLTVPALERSPYVLERASDLGEEADAAAAAPSTVAAGEEGASG